MEAYLFDAMAAAWQESLQVMLRMVARDTKELEEYAAKPDANQKAVSIRRERLQITSRFLELTVELLDAQKEEIADSRRRAHLLRHAQQELEKIRAYGASKGLDLSLLPYMRVTDFA